MTLSLLVMEAAGSMSLIAMKIFLCFTGRFTEFSDSELPNSNSDWCGVSVVGKFNFGSMGDDAFVVCGG